MKTARHTTRRIRYRADPMAALKVINRLEPFTPAELIELELPIRLAFDSIKNGRGTLQDISDIGAAINTTMVRAESISPKCVLAAIAARDALQRTLTRYHSTGRVGFDGPAIADVAVGIDLHEQMLRLSTPVQMADALREVMRRTAEQQTIQ